MTRPGVDCHTAMGIRTTLGPDCLGSNPSSTNYYKYFLGSRPEPLLTSAFSSTEWVSRRVASTKRGNVGKACSPCLVGLLL